MISTYIDQDSVVFCGETKKVQVINQLIEKAVGNGTLTCPNQFKEAIFDRESIMSTGLGMGVAVPHAKIDGINEFFVVCGVLENPVDWDALDGEPVDLVFLIGGPAERQKDYLMLLSKITLVIKNEETRKALRDATSAEAFMKQFQGL